MFFFWKSADFKHIKRAKNEVERRRNARKNKGIVLKRHKRQLYPQDRYEFFTYADGKSKLSLTKIWRGGMVCKLSHTKHIILKCPLDVLSQGIKNSFCTETRFREFSVIRGKREISRDVRLFDASANEYK